MSWSTRACPTPTDASGTSGSWRRCAAERARHHRGARDGRVARDLRPAARARGAPASSPCRAVVPLWQTPETSFDEMRAQLRLRDERGRLWRGGVAKFFIDGVDRYRYRLAVRARHAGRRHRAVLARPGALRRGGRAVRPSRVPVRHPRDRRPRRARRAGRVPRRRRAPRACATGSSTSRRSATRTSTRFAREGVVASMQPLHMQWRRADDSDSWAARLGPERAARAFRTAICCAAARPSALGSDWPVAQNDPRVGMAWARLRRAPGRPGRRRSSPSSGCPADTLHGYTTRGRRRWSGRRSWVGASRPGCAPTSRRSPRTRSTLAADELPALPVTLTVVDGESSTARATRRASRPGPRGWRGRRSARPAPRCPRCARSAARPLGGR